MLASLIAVIAALGTRSDIPELPASVTESKVVAIVSRPDGAATAPALPSGGPDFDALMLRWSATETASSRERLELPVAVTHLSSRFGVRRDPLQNGLRAHLGIDIPDPIGTPVHAAGSGVVTFAGWSHGYGNLVRIDHGDGNETRYAHLSAIAVGIGSVEQGTVIGNVGSTGRSTGAHLHFEVRQNGAPVDPLGQDGLPLGRGERQLPVPLHPHWSGFDANAAALPQSRLR